MSDSTDARIDEEDEDSFPASDPPARWAGEDARDVNPEQEAD